MMKNESFITNKFPAAICRFLIVLIDYYYYNYPHVIIFLIFERHINEMVTLKMMPNMNNIENGCSNFSASLSI